MDPAELLARQQERLAESQIRWFLDTIHDILLHRPDELARAIEEFSQALRM